MFTTQEEHSGDEIIRTTTFTTSHVVPEPEVPETEHVPEPMVSEPVVEFESSQPEERPESEQG